MTTSREHNGFSNSERRSRIGSWLAGLVTRRRAKRADSLIPPEASRRTAAGHIARTIRLAQLAPIVTAASFVGLAYLISDGFRSEVEQAATVLSQGDAPALRNYIRSFGVWAPAISLLLMVLQALVAPVPSFVVTFANGLAFGVFWGWLLSVTGHALAAAVCFWIARAIGRGPVEVLAGRIGLTSADHWFARNGAYTIFLARLAPGMAFDAVSYAAGLLQIGFGKFIVATILGTLPQTFIYAYLGQNAPQFIWLLLAGSVVVVVGIAVAQFVAQRRRQRAAAPASGIGPKSTPRSGVNPNPNSPADRIPNRSDQSHARLVDSANHGLVD